MKMGKKLIPKMKMKMKKLGKMNSIFEFSISEFRLRDNFHENLRKNFDPFFKTFLTNRSKKEVEDEKIWKNKSNI